MNSVEILTGLRFAAVTAVILFCSPAYIEPVKADEIRVLATGATKSVVTSLGEAFRQRSGHAIVLDVDTAGGVQKRIEGGAVYPVVIATRGVIDGLSDKGKLVKGSRVDIASTSIGVAVKDGAPKPDISTVDAFKKTLLDAKTIAYVDPASGGTSGIYIAKVLDTLGLTDALKPKLRLKAGGYVAELVASGEAEIAIHQISEILPVKGVTMIGELPKEIQSVTVYSGAVMPGASEAARAFLAFATGSEAAVLVVKSGMVQPK